MKLFCSHCGRPIAADPGPAAQRFPCPHCGGVNLVPAASEATDGLRAPEPEFVRSLEKRRRDTVLVGVAILGLLSLLAWLLLHPSATGSAGRGVKNALFGQRITAAVEQARGQGDAASDSGTRGQAGRAGQPAAAGQPGAEGQAGTAAQAGAAGQLPAEMGASARASPMSLWVR